MIMFTYIDVAGCVDTCHSNATCQNINGNHLCVCNLGFVGNGTFCEGKWVIWSLFDISIKACFMD